MRRYSPRDLSEIFSSGPLEARDSFRVHGQWRLAVLGPASLAQSSGPQCNTQSAIGACSADGAECCNSETRDLNFDSDRARCAGTGYDL